MCRFVGLLRSVVSVLVDAERWNAQTGVVVDGVGERMQHKATVGHERGQGALPFGLPERGIQRSGVQALRLGFR